MARVADTSAEHEEIPTADTRAQRVRNRLQRKVPPGAKFQRLWASYGAHTRCDGCNYVIDWDEIEYELKFRHEARVLTITLHRDCWEIWRDA